MSEEKSDKNRDIKRPNSPAPPPNPGRAPMKPVEPDKDDDRLEIAKPGAAFSTDATTGRPSAGSATTRRVGSRPQPKPPNASVAGSETPPLGSPTTPGAGIRPQAPSSPSPASKDSPVKSHTSRPPHTVAPGSAQKVRKLSSDKAREISTRLNSGGSGLSEEQSKKYIKSLESGGVSPPGASSVAGVTGSVTGQASIVTPGVISSGGGASGPVRGIAYFNGPVITLTTPEPMTSGDEIVVRNHRYQLKPGGAQSKSATYMLALALTVVAFLAGRFLSGDDPMGAGSIVGIALDQSGAPYHSGAVVRLPELGNTTYTDESGFFRFDEIQPGTYKIEYTLSGSRGGSASVSVSDGVITLVSLEDAGKKVVSARKQSRQKRSSGGSKKASSSSSGSSKTSSRGSLAVTSKTRGALVYLDDQRLGEVNNTFRRIRTGKREVRIEKSGFRSTTVLVAVKPNKLARVDVDLERTPSPVGKSASGATKALSAADHYNRGVTHFKKGRLEQALLSLEQALKLKPSMADAFFMRAEISSAEGYSDDAFDDYLRAGEIWRVQKRFGDALASLDNAVEQSPDNPIGYKVRGDIYDARGHSIIAVEDYNKALKIDKKYYEARLALGISLFNNGSTRRALKELRRARDYNDEDPVLYHYLMLASLARKDYGDVNNYFKQFKTIASEADLKRFYGDARFAGVRKVFKD